MEDNNKQDSLFSEFEELTWWKKYWQDMPEYTQEKLEPVKQVIMSFDNYHDYFKFAELIGQNLTKKTKSAWFPKLENVSFVDKRWVQDDKK
tara:strand:+ start:334 stop:606 length:273 start_codon:yes stop_codon:yes gene_type:complete